MQENGIGSVHPENAQFFCEIPSNDDHRWINGKPSSTNMQFLTLSPFYPTQRLDVCVEINKTPKIMTYENHPAFSGCVKFMPIDLLDFRPIPKYIERVIYTIGLCHYEHSEHYKSAEVLADNQMKAIEKGNKILNPSPLEHVKFVSCKSNDAYDEYHHKKTKLKM